jgi:hypothetical protein
MIPDLPGYMFDQSWAGLASFAVAVLLPLVAALVMKASWSSTVKGFVLLVVSAVKTFGEAFLLQGADFNAAATGYAVALNFAVAVVFYFGLLKDSQIQQKALSTGIR